MRMAAYRFAARLGWAFASVASALVRGAKRRADRLAIRQLDARRTLKCLE